jgi:hypothetical protein
LPFYPKGAELASGQVSWLAGQRFLPTFPAPWDQWLLRENSPLTVAGPRRTFTGFPIKSFDTRMHNIFFALEYHIIIFLSTKDLLILY